MAGIVYCVSYKGSFKRYREYISVATVLLSGCTGPAAHSSFCVYVLYHEICRFVQFLCYCPLIVLDVDTLKSKYYWSSII